MKSLIKEFYNPELKWVPHYWVVFASNGEDTEFWDDNLDKCKAFCEARGWDYEIVPLDKTVTIMRFHKSDTEIWYEVLGKGRRLYKSAHKDDCLVFCDEMGYCVEEAIL